MMDQWGGTALVIAATYGIAPVISMLLNAGASVDEKDVRDTVQTCCGQLIIFACDCSVDSHIFSLTCCD